MYIPAHFDNARILNEKVKVGPISATGAYLNHIMRRTTTNLDNGKRVLFSLRRFLSVTVKVDTSERFHRLIIK